MLIAGPTSGYLSDRFGARPFATGGMLGTALSFGLLLMLPIDFPYPAFAAILFLTGISMGLFASPNRAAVMNSLPAGERGAGGGMNQTFQNSAQVMSVGIFFTLLVVGLSSSLPSTHAVVTGSSFFPHLISGPFSDGLDAAFVFAIVACLVAAFASLLRGGRYHHADAPAGDQGALPHIQKLEEQHAR
jgi:MFS family permease